MIEIYGIKNCDTMKKAFRWLDEHDVPYKLHDYKKDGFDAAVIEKAIAQHGWEKVLNKRGTSWRALDDRAKAEMDADRAVSAAAENPSMVKRPLMIAQGEIILGFDEDDYQEKLL